MQRRTAVQFDLEHNTIQRSEKGRQFLDDMGIQFQSHTQDAKRESGYLYADILSREMAWKRAMAVPVMQYYRDTRAFTEWGAVDSEVSTPDTQEAINNRRNAFFRMHRSTVPDFRREKKKQKRDMTDAAKNIVAEIRQNQRRCVGITGDSNT